MSRIFCALVIATAAWAATPAAADAYSDAIQVFRQAGQSGEFFGKSYGYAVFPTIGKGGIGIGGARGKMVKRQAAQRLITMPYIR